MRVVAGVELLAIAVLLLLLAREGGREVSAYSRGRREAVEVFDPQLRMLRDELHMALDRVQAPDLALQESQGERLAREQESGPVRINSEDTERTLGDDERDRAKAYLRTELEDVEQKLRERGVDPSELSRETGGFSADLLAGGE